MNPEQLQQWFENFLQVLADNGIDVHNSVDTLRLGVFESVSNDPEDPHYKVKDAIDNSEPSRDAKMFLAGKKKFSAIEGGPESVFDVNGLLNRRTIADIGPEEQLALFNKVQKGEVYISSPDFDAQKNTCVYIGDPVEGNQYPICVQNSKAGIVVGFDAQDLEEIDAYLENNNYVFKNKGFGELVIAAKANGANDQDSIQKSVDDARKHIVFPGRQSLDIANKFYEFSMLQTSMAADLSDDIEEAEPENAEEAPQEQADNGLDELEVEEERSIFSTSMAMAKKSWKVNLLNDYKNHPEFYATEELRRERNKDFYYSEIASFLKSNDLGIFTSDELDEFKTRAASLNSSALLAFDSALKRISSIEYPEGLSAQVLGLGQPDSAKNDLDYFFLSGRIVRNGHTYSRVEGEKPWDIYNSIVRDIVSGVEVCVRTDRAEGGLPVCYSLNYVDGELKLAKGTTVLMSDEDRVANKKELTDLRDALNRLGDTSRDSQEYKAMKAQLINAADHFSEISTVKRYDGLMRDLSDTAARYYFAKVDQSMNARRSGRFRVAEDLFIYPEKFKDEKERLENRIASKIVAAKLRELQNTGDWRANEADLAFKMPGSFKDLITEVKAQPEFHNLVDGKSEKALTNIFEGSPSKLLATNSKCANAIMSNLKAKHFRETIVNSEYENKEAVIDKLSDFTGILNKLSGPKDSKEFVAMKQQLEDTMLALKNTKDKDTIERHLNDLREKSINYFATKISEGMTNTRPNRVRAAMYIVNAVDSVAGKKENSMLASTGRRGTLETMLAARLTKQILQNAAKKDPAAKRALENPDIFANKIQEAFESANFQNFLVGKNDQDLAKLMTLSTSDLAKAVASNTKQPNSKTMLASIKSLANYNALQNSPKPFTTKEALDELNKTNPLELSVTRGIVMDLCKAKMMQDGYSMDDVLNPKLLSDVKQSYANRIIPLIREGNAQEIFGIMKAGCEALSNQIKTSLGEINSLDEIIANGKYKNLIHMGQVFKSMHQDIDRIPNELKTEDDRTLVDNWFTDIDTLGEFTNSVKNYVDCAGKFLDGNQSLLGKCNEHFSGEYTQYKLVNSIFKDIVNGPNAHQDVSSGLMSGGQPTQALVNLKQVKLYCVGEFDETAMFRNVKTSEDLKAVGEKLFDGSIGFDVVIDNNEANNIKSINGMELEMAVQKAVVSKQNVK